ncbi:MAG TPA: sensor histidine kinase, partial [Marinilabiliaceae bacterium]|nr:sensor histidine kinase [Marinilabiliaceae bacterium]
MKQALRKILTGLTVLLLFPVVIAIVYEYTRINENEEHISTVYKEQLETVITSINYYTGDIASNWASRIDLWLMHPSDTAIINRLSKENASIRAIYLSSPDGGGKTVYRSSPEAANDTALGNIIASEKEAIEQLNSYFDNNYRKFISYPTQTNSIAMLFICKGADNENLVCIIELELQQFLQHHINPRIQAIARDNFLIELLYVPSGTILLRASGQASGATRYDQEGEM